MIKQQTKIDKCIDKSWTIYFGQIQTIIRITELDNQIEDRKKIAKNLNKIVDI